MAEQPARHPRDLGRPPQELRAHINIRLDNKNPITVFTRMEYLPATHPLEITLFMHMPSPHESRTWILGRSILLGGLTRKTGGHDVSVQPVRKKKEEDPDKVKIEFDTPSGNASFVTLKDPLEAFLNRTLEQVPVEYETEAFNHAFDAALPNLLNS